MKYRARANGNEIELSDEAAAELVPAIYEQIDEEPVVPPSQQSDSTGQTKVRKPR